VIEAIREVSAWIYLAIEIALMAWLSFKIAQRM
jgi:hypothetical protein